MTPPRLPLRHPVRTVLLGGLSAGMLDIVYAFGLYGLKGIGPDRVLQGVASGIWGRAAYAGGWPLAAAGLGLHLAMATAFAAAYVQAGRHLLPGPAERPWAGGIALGVAAFLVMHGLVVPLSQAVPQPQLGLWDGLGTLAVHVLLIGLPIAHITGRAARPEPGHAAAVL